MTRNLNNHGICTTCMFESVCDVMVVIVSFVWNLLTIWDLVGITLLKPVRCDSG